MLRALIMTDSDSEESVARNIHSADTPADANDPKVDHELTTGDQNSEKSSGLSSVHAVKLRTRREPSEKSKQYQITLLKTNISKCISSRLGLYEQSFSKIDKTDYNALYDYLSFLETDSDEIDTLYDKLKVLCDNKMDEQIESLCTVFFDERKTNIESVNVLLDQIEETEEQENLRLEEELRRQIEQIEEQRKRQAEARRLLHTRHRAQPSQELYQAGISEEPDQQTLNTSTNQTAPIQTQAQTNNNVGAINQTTEDRSLQHFSTSSRPPTANMESQERANTSPVHYIKELPQLSVADTESNSSVQLVSTNNSELNAMERLASSITESMKATKRTIVEPTIFSGDPMKFKDWETDFDDFLEAESITTSTRKMRMLKRFIDGEARKCIEGFLLDDNISSYNEARNLLKERFGKKINISRHLKKQLKDWPRIGNTDGLALQQFGDFLTHLSSAKQTSQHLNSLDEPESNEEILEKLPYWLTTKWKYQIVKHQKSYDEYPPFKVFREFICDEASATNVLGIKEDTRREQNTESQVRKGSAPRKVQTLQLVSTDNRTNGCKKCGMDNHYTAQCQQLIKATYEDALEFFKQNQLCFRCGKHQHKHNECPKKWKCKFCQREHPDCLHKVRADWETQKLGPSAPTQQPVQQHENDAITEHRSTSHLIPTEQEMMEQPVKQNIVAAADRKNISRWEASY